ncbi:MAG TPA: EAL domain-containing protein [Polyangiaceae bacterium]
MADTPGPVLVVDDDVALARAMQRVLVAAGRDVVLAHDGRAAAEAIATRAFDVVVTDVNMPGISGVELLRAVRAKDLDVPVILVTGNPSLEVAMEAISLGALQYLAKPTPNDVLVAAVTRASLLHKIARVERDALSMDASSHLAGDQAGLQASFERALDTMWMAFQPIVAGENSTLYGYEALMRAKEPSLPHPGAILDAAERLGRLEDLGRRVRSLAARDFEHAPGDARLFVNLHTRDLLDESLFEPTAPLARFAERVVLELTERASLHEVADVAARVARLRSAGYRIAIDDLGAGYAGLSSFAALEPEIVKLDMSLVRNVHQSSIRRRLVASMTSLCEEMNIQVVAEGIETAGERDCIVGLRCGLLQGYLFARPGPAFPAVAT